MTYRFMTYAVLPRRRYSRGLEKLRSSEDKVIAPTLGIKRFFTQDMSFELVLKG